MTATEHEAHDSPVLVIRPPSRSRISARLNELWASRELVVFLTWRNVLVRYKQTVLGVAWAMLQPFFLMVVFTIAFGRLAKIPSDGIPYPVFSYAALLPWTFFSSSLTQSANSLVGSSNLLSKVYFPRLAIPFSVVLAALADLAAAFVVLLGMMGWYGIWPTSWAILTLPLLVLLAVITALGIGLTLAALNVLYRDVQYVVPFLAQLWLFATPVVYPASLVHNDTLRLLLGLNPMAGVVEGFRWALLGTSPGPGWMLALSTAIALLLFVVGLLTFGRMERRFADSV